MQWAVLSEEGKYLFVLIFLQVRIWFGPENIIGIWFMLCTIGCAVYACNRQVYM